MSILFKIMNGEFMTDFFAKLYQAAHAAGLDAGKSAMPIPMVFEGGVPGQKKTTYVVEDGPCGLVTIKLHSASNFAKFLIANKIAKKGFDWRVANIFVYDFGQSLVRQEAYADAFVAVLKNAGIEKVFVSSHID